MPLRAVTVLKRVAQGQTASSLSTSAYCQARQRLPQNMVDRAYRLVGKKLEASLPLQWRWRERRVVLFDGTTLSMPDTPKISSTSHKARNRSQDWVSPEMVKKEISVHILANNLVRWVMATAAYLGEVIPRLLSFTGTKRVLMAFAAELRRCTNQRLSTMFATVLGMIASLRLPIRPNRVAPRAR